MVTRTEWTPWETEFYHLARQSGEMGDGMLRSFSGADQADSEKHFCARRVYVAIAALGPDASDAAIELALDVEDRRWREYAAAQAAKVAAAPKIKRGPSSGHSVIGHRWVSPDSFQTTAGHIRTMVKIIRERLAGII